MKIDLGVTVFGRMPFKVGRRLIGTTKTGKPVWGPLEQKGSLCPSEKPVIKAKKRKRAA